VRPVSYESDVNPFDAPLVPKLTKLKISTSGGGGNLKADSWAVAAILKEMDLEAEVSGRLEVKLDDGKVELSGKEMTIEIENEKFSADTGVITFANKQLASVELIGDVKLSLHDAPIVADKVQMVGRAQEPTCVGPFYFSSLFSSLRMFGRISINDIEDQEGMAWSADSVELKSNGVLLQGNARLEILCDGRRQVYTGDSVSVNDEQFEIACNGTLEFEKGTIKKTWKGKKLRMSDEGLTVDGEAQDYSEFWPEEE